jgi:hypothetical protein
MLPRKLNAKARPSRQILPEQEAISAPYDAGTVESLQPNNKVVGSIGGTLAATLAKESSLACL